VSAEAYQFSPYRINVLCYCDGRVHLRLDAEPFGNTYARKREMDDVYYGPIDEFDADAARETMRERAPFVTSRVGELTRWHGVNTSHAWVIALRELELTYGEVADLLEGVSKGTARSYISKFNDSFDEGLGGFVARAGEPKRILSKREFSNDRTRFICRTVREDVDSPVWLVTVVATDGPSAVLDITSERFESVGELIDEKYDGAAFIDRDRMQEWNKLFRTVDERFVEENIRERLDEATVELTK
jgi:hypothetical protein